MKRFFAIFLILSILVSIIPAGFAESSFFSDPAAIEHAADSVVMLTCYDSDGKPFASGSGFAAFDAGVIVTNYHVIEGDVAAVQAHTEAGLYFDINEVLCYDIVSDIAILKTNARIGLDLLETGSSSLLKGSRVVAIGSPQGFMNTVSEGIYSGIYILDTEYLLFSASISAGSSGGALFNEDGKVIGITSATWTEGQNLNLAVPIEKVEALWESYKNGTYVEPKEQAAETAQSPILEGALYPKVPIDYYVMLCRPDGGLLDYIDYLLYKAWESGTLLQLAEKYNLSERIIEIPQKTLDAGFTSADLDAIRSNGVLKIGIIPQWSYSHQDEVGNWSGFDLDLAEFFADEIGVKAEIIEGNNTNKLSALRNRKYDILIGGCKTSYTFANDFRTVPYIASTNGIDETQRVYDGITDFYKDLEKVTEYSAGKRLIETYLSDTEYYDEAFLKLKPIIYKQAKKQYNAKNYTSAVLNFSALNGYGDSKKYLALITAIQRTHYWEQWEEADKKAYSALLDILWFADAKDVMIRCYPEHFLKGTWKTSSGKYYFKLKKKNDDLQASYSLPYKDLSNSYFSFEDGVYVLRNKSKSKDVFKFTIIDKNTIKVYCYKNGKTYTMYRQ